MKTYTLDDFTSALAAVGIAPGDTVMVHAALFGLGRLQGVPVPRMAAALAERLLGLLGAQGTLVVPIFNYEGIAFFKDYKLRQMGPLAEHVAAMDQARRTYHAIFSLAAVGRLADDIAAHDALSAYGPDGPFEYLAAQNAKALLLGIGVSAASILHVAEERVGVPYRYWMEFPGTRPGPQGPEEVPYTMFVRDLATYPSLDTAQVETWLREDGVLRTAPLGGGLVHACAFADHIATVERRLRERPGALVGE